MLYLLWIIPALIIIYAYAGYKRKQSLLLFAETDLLKRINITLDPGRRVLKATLLLAAFIFIVFALVRPGWNPKPVEIRRKGRDLVFVLDVSRSMLAEDLMPNRLERAKYAVLDTVERLEGDRVALVAFAGTAAVLCPLTLDYGFFRSMVKRFGINSISTGGTLIGDALRKVMGEVFDDQEKLYKDIILITDGEDHDSFPVEAAVEVGRRGIRLIAVGLGDEDQGKRVPVTDERGNTVFLTYNDQEVWSKLDADTLRKMVNATPGGRYLNVATGTFDLGDIYVKLIAGAEKKELESKTMKKYEEKFQIFIAIAFGLLSAEVFISVRRRRKKDA